ncbi:MAG: type 2 isopentenyl-diphosphate Delta-isomerase [Deltaproteobacteria bacterium]|nr:type 2 isopentenyl-diphosphate Delta-isomerase [Deltaproteobacteria bacterium]
MADRADRKLDHIRLCTAADVTPVCYPPARTTLLECVELLPEGFPVVSVDDVETSTVFLGYTVAAPIFVSAMTGGPSRAGELNRSLARVCQKMRLPLALGSGRPMLDDETLASSYDVRPEAPDIPVLANIGMAQASMLPVDRLSWLVERTRADALVVHLNFAMEAVQPEGDRDPGPVVETLTRLVGELGHPVVVKEVGGGFTRGQIEAIASTGVDWIDVAGAGGTSWVRIEGLRGSLNDRRMASTFSCWGIPTAAALGWAERSGLSNVLASGGLRSGLDVARSLAMGARLAGMALPVIRAMDSGGEESLERLLGSVIRELRLAVHLCGKRSTAEMADVPTLLLEPLRTWLAD